MYFSELYFICYEFSKLASYSVCFISWYRICAAKCTQQRAPRATAHWARVPRWLATQARRPTGQIELAFNAFRAVPRLVAGDCRSHRACEGEEPDAFDA